MRRLFLLLVVLALPAAACDPGEPDPSTPAADSATPTASAVPTLVSVGGAGSTPPAGMEALLAADLARRLSLDPARVRLVSFTPQTWPDGCLGLAPPGRVCTQALVPGWLAILEAPDGTLHRYRGAAGRFEPEP